MFGSMVVGVWILFHHHCVLADSDGWLRDPCLVDALTRRSTLQGKDFLRYGRSSAIPENILPFSQEDDKPKIDKRIRNPLSTSSKANFIRLGRAKDNFMRFGKSKDNFMRFGRAKDTNYLRFGRAKDNNYLRFERAKDNNFLRFGRAKDNNFLRFGRAKDNFIRFGRGDRPVQKSGRAGSMDFLTFLRNNSFRSNIFLPPIKEIKPKTRTVEQTMRIG